MIVQRRGDWLSAKAGDELVMMSVEKGTYLGLSAVGVRIWELIETPRTFDDICAQLKSEFDVPMDVCRAEVEAFLTDLAKQGAVAVEPLPEPSRSA